MKIPWPTGKCILCLNNSSDTFEHIIPEFIGGKLSAFILCNKCNNFITGSKLISTLKKDPSIRLAIQNLKNEIPDLEESFENGQIYIGKDINNNFLKFIRKKSSFKILEHQKDDNSLIKDTKKVEQYITKKLKKEGLSSSEIQDKLEEFKQLDDNKMMQLTKNEKMIKWEMKEFQIDLSGPLFDRKIILLIAYEYLSLLIGELIYEEKLDFVRNYLLRDIESPNFKIDSFRTKKYSPHHSIYPKFYNSNSLVVITIILFGYFRFDVKFHITSPLVPDYVYLEDLKNKKTMFSNSLEDAKKGKYFELNFKEKKA